MSKITQYRPAFFEGFVNETAHFETMGDLLSIPFVANFANDEGFFRFSISDEMLMAEYDGGKKWWVVGRFEAPPNVGLPTWHGKPNPA